MCVCVCVCVCPPPGYSCEMKPELTNQISPAFQFLCTAFAIDTNDGRGLSNEARCELLPKKSKVMLYLLFITQ